MKKRLTIEDRILIEQLLKLNYKLKEISSILDCESSTVSREIKKRRITGKGDYKECEKTGCAPGGAVPLAEIGGWRFRLSALQIIV